MGLREDREYLEQQREARFALKESAEKQAQEDAYKLYEARENAKLAHEAMFEHYHEYKNDVKKTLLTEALMNIYKDSIFHINERENAICESLLGNYINETGVDTLLKNMKFSESGLLHDIYDNVNKYYQKITEDAEPEDITTQTIKPEDVDAFWKDIDKSNDIDDITSMIRLRVSDAEENFINKNAEDKEDVKSILKNTADRIQSAKETNDNDYSESVEESEMALAKQQIYKVQHESHRSVFDRMVRNLSESALANDDARKHFTQENGRLDMDAIVESARCMYTLLEMVSTLQIEKVDAQYIEDTLKSIG
jgi:hypothetical protein